MLQVWSMTHGSVHIEQVSSLQGAARQNFANAGKKLSENCKRELQNFKMEQAENVNANIPLGEYVAHCTCLILLVVDMQRTQAHKVI